MADRVAGNSRTFIAKEAHARYARLKFTAGANDYVEVAGAADNAIGIAQDVGVAGQPCSVLLNSAPGTRCYIASAAITQGVEVEAAAAGKVVTLAAGVSLGQCLVAASADGDIIEVAVGEE